MQILFANCIDNQHFSAALAGG